jgi:hypothetical protein
MDSQDLATQSFTASGRVAVDRSGKQLFLSQCVATCRAPVQQPLVLRTPTPIRKRWFVVDANSGWVSVRPAVGGEGDSCNLLKYCTEML